MIETKQKDIYEKVPPLEYKGYYFPSFIENIIRRLRLNRSLYISGESGTGKTELVYK